MLDVVRLNDDKIKKAQKTDNPKVIRRNRVTAIKKESRNDSRDNNSFKQKLIEVTAVKDTSESDDEKDNSSIINDGVIVDKSLSMKLNENSVINKLVSDKIVNNPNIKKYIDFEDVPAKKIEVIAEKIEDGNDDVVDKNSIESSEDNILSGEEDINNEPEEKLEPEEELIVIEDREDNTKHYKVDIRTKEILDILYKIRQNCIDKSLEIKNMKILNSEKKSRLQEIDIDLALVETQIKKILLDKQV